MTAPTSNLDRTMTVTLANPTPPTNVAVTYQGTPPTPVGLVPAVTQAAGDAGLFADPLEGAVATQWSGTDARPVTVELAGKAEADGTEVTTAVGSTTGHSVLGNYTEAPNASHPSGSNLGGPELVTGGDFAASTGWTLSGGATVGTGTLNMNGTGAGTAVRTASQPITAGAYLFEFDVIQNAGTPITVGIGGTTLVVTGSNLVGHYSGTITTAAASQNLSLFCSGTVCKLDNFSVRRAL